MRTLPGSSGAVTPAMGRRSFLRLAGSAALVAAAGPALAACSSSSSGTAAASWNGKLKFQGWDFQPDTIKRLVGAWSDANKVPVDVGVIPNVGYSPAIQTRLRGGELIDVYYNFAYNSQKFIQQGWARKLNGLSDVDSMLSDMFPSARKRHVTANGTIISAPYFSAVHMLHYNKSYVAKAGFSGAPTSLTEIYNQSKKMKESGIAATPYVAYWVKEFCEEYFNVYLLSAGVTPFGSKGEPAFADDAKSVEVFDWWRTMYQEGLTPKSVLTDDPGKLSGEVAQGRAAFFVLHHYFLSSIHDAKGPESENVAMAPVGSGGGKTLQIGEVLQMGNVKADKERDAAWKLMKYYGWKDEAGKFSVFKEWAKAAGLAAPYPGFFTDPDIKAAFPAYYDLSMLSQTFESGSDVVPARTLPWYPTFQAKVGDIVHAMLLGQQDAKKTVSALADAVKQSQAGGGL